MYNESIEIVELENDAMASLCICIKAFLKEGKIEESKDEIETAMCLYPHSPIPHNLMGILLEQENNHLLAMRHFRAAYALEPTYLPVRYNLALYASFDIGGEPAYDERDCKNLY